MTQYLGDVDGNLVMADKDATLESQLPALRAKTVLADCIRAPETSDEYSRITLNGGKLRTCRERRFDLKDAEVRPRSTIWKAAYAASGPASAVITAGQAKGTSTLSIPYKFISASIHLGAYMSAQRLNLIGLLAPAAQLARPTAMGNFSGAFGQPGIVV